MPRRFAFIDDSRLNLSGMIVQVVGTKDKRDVASKVVNKDEGSTKNDRLCTRWLTVP